MLLQHWYPLTCYGYAKMLKLNVLLWIVGIGHALRYNTTSTRSASRLNVHLVPHSHDDVVRRQPVGVS